MATGAEGQAQAQAQGSSAPTAMGKHSLEHRGESRDPPAPAPAVADETAETSTVRRLLRGQRGHVTGHSPSSCQHHQPAASQLMGLMSLGTDTPAPRDQVSHLQRKSCSQPPTAKPRINSSLECQLVFLILLLKDIWVDWEGSSRTVQEGNKGEGEKLETTSLLLVHKY